MTGGVRTAVLVLLFVVWVATMAYRLSPSLQQRYPGGRNWAHLIGWIAIAGLLIIVFLT